MVEDGDIILEWYKISSLVAALWLESNQKKVSEC